jgi:general stress protein YciG
VTVFDGGWPPGFPRVTHFIDRENSYAKPWTVLTSRRDYDAAKNRGDRAAALRLVRGFLDSPENTALLRTLKADFPGAVVVPVRDAEENGGNRIPEMLAEYMAARAGFTVDTGIVQTNKTGRTGSGVWHRFAFRPEFDGPVKPGGNYILADDVFTCGGSFGELRRHIGRNGGNVVRAAALSCGGYGDCLAVRPETLKRLLDRFGERGLYSFLKETNIYDGNCKALAEPEAAALGRASSLDEAGDRIAEAGRRGGARRSLETHGGREAARLTQSPVRRGGFRR